MRPQPLPQNPEESDSEETDSEEDDLNVRLRQGVSCLISAQYRFLSV